jgi:hypothetical protein
MLLPAHRGLVAPVAALSAAGGGAPYGAKAVHFDGSQFLNINSLTATDSGLLSVSFWFRRHVIAASAQLWTVDPAGIYLSTCGFGQAAGPSSLFTQNIANAANTDNASIDTTGVAISLDIWHHVLLSMDVSGAGIAKLYLDRVDAGTAIFNGAPFTIAFNGLSFMVGADTFGGDEFIGDVADLWIAPGQSLLIAGDIPSATLDKFVTAGIKPVDLGADGSTPTGTAPAIFFSDDASAFGQPNLGTGGAFTLTGSLTNASTSPSD